MRALELALVALSRPNIRYIWIPPNVTFCAIILKTHNPKLHLSMLSCWAREWEVYDSILVADSQGSAGVWLVCRQLGTVGYRGGKHVYIVDTGMIYILVMCSLHSLLLTAKVNWAVAIPKAWEWFYHYCPRLTYRVWYYSWLESKSSDIACFGTMLLQLTCLLLLLMWLVLLELHAIYIEPRIYSSIESFPILSNSPNFGVYCLILNMSNAHHPLWVIT